MYISKRWLWLLLFLALGSGGYFFFFNTEVNAQGFFRRGSSGSTNAETTTTDGPATVTIQPASALLTEVSASGHIALIDEQVVVANVGGAVQSIAVKVGARVAAGDLLLTLDTVELERAVKRAELTVDAQRNALDQLEEPATAAEIALAEANLASAEQNLADVMAGPSSAEVAAARSSLASAWSKYNELQAGPSQAELTQLSADQKKAEIALAEARRAYDKVVWRNDIGMTSEAAALQDATIDYEKSKAAYEQSITAADNSEVQSAVSSAQNAQAQLDDLLNSPTAADIATAQAQVADAQAQLADLQQGPSDSDRRSAEISLEQTLVDLEEAYANLAAAKVYAPIAGTVLSLATSVGERVSEGATVVTLADTSQLELTIDVAELDVPQIAVGQPAAIEIDAVTGTTYRGEITDIAPSSDSSSGVVYYPVTILLTDDQLTNIRPGMTAVATIQNTQSAANNGWLVPTTALQQQNGQSVVMVVRDGAQTPVTVTTGAVQGEWTVVQSDALQAGDQVAGSVASYTNENSGFGPGGGGPRDGGGPPPGQ